MTAETVLLEDFGISWSYLNRFVEVVKGEGLGMPKAVVGLGDHLGYKIVREVAIDADGRGMVRRLLPGGELFLHDVAVGAGLGIFTEIGATLSVTEGKDADPEETSGEESDDEDGFDSPHPRITVGLELMGG